MSEPPLALVEEPLGAGSGGGGPASRMPVGPDGNHAFYSKGHYEIIASEVELMAEAANPCVTIEAFYEQGGSTGGRAFVNVHADKGIRMTSGTTPAVNAINTDGIVMITDDNQPILLTRGEVSSNPQQVSIGTDGFMIDANLANLVIQSMHSITLQVAGGTSSISLTPEGITLTGPLININ
jgi:hypothetical protein